MTAQKTRRVQRVQQTDRWAKRWYRSRWFRGVKMALAVGLISWGGYALSNDVRAMGASNTVVNDGVTIESEYPDLPQAVAKSIQSVVSLQRLTASGSRNGWVASGVILNNHQVLTAGHATDDGGKSLSCSNISVAVPGFMTAAAASRLPATYGSAEYGETVDAALLSVKADTNFRNLPAVTLASAPPKAGDTVFFINYEPRADGTLRNPLAEDSNDPAVFSGVVIGTGKHGLAVATGAGQSYGHGDPETMLRKGASGGAVVNARGELVGLSVSSESLQANRSADYIALNYGVRLPAHQYQVGNVQLLDSTLLTRLQSSLTSCSQ